MNIMYGKNFYHNEIELLSIADSKLRKQIENIFLKENISYCIKWEECSFYKKLLGYRKESYIIMINNREKERVIELLEPMAEQIKNNGKFLLKKAENSLKEEIVIKDSLLTPYE
ncbi:MAG: hypothetical protein ACRC7V_05175 [Lachnospiraceae bacterium]